MIAPLPESWASALPLAGPTVAPAPPRPGPPVDLPDLLERLRATTGYKRGEIWDCLRRAVRGERMFRIQGGPGDPEIPLVVGVDEFVSKGLLWTLANAVHPATGEAWCQVRAEDIGTLFDASLEHLRSDCRSLGQESKFTAAHIATKWAALVPKIQGERDAAASFVARMEASAQAHDPTRDPERAALPLVLQLDSAFFVLDDRPGRPPRYHGPMQGNAVTPLAAQVWAAADPPRVLEVPNPRGQGTRPMTAAEIMRTYGRSITGLVTDLAADAPHVQDLTLTRPGLDTDPPAPREDPEVAAWLQILAGTAPVLANLQAWIAHADRPRLAGVAPALVLVGGAHVGKSLLAQGVAAALGLDACAPLGRALGRFAGVVQTHPIVFSDEGLPRNHAGQPMTEEFRDLVTRSNHLLELKGLNTNVVVRGGVRVILAANRADRLFSNRGNLGADDVAALIRRLLVIDVQGAERCAKAKAAAVALGAFENDPARLARVAGHFRWLQVGPGADARPAPEPSAGSIRAELRRGGDVAGASLAALTDAADSGADWIAVDPSPYTGAEHGIAWVQPDAWARAAMLAPGALVRALAGYVARENSSLRRHPVTGLPSPDGRARVRWVGLDLGALTADGIELERKDPA